MAKGMHLGPPDQSATAGPHGHLPVDRGTHYYLCLNICCISYILSCCLLICGSHAIRTLWNINSTPLRQWWTESLKCFLCTETCKLEFRCEDSRWHITVYEEWTSHTFSPLSTVQLQADEQAADTRSSRLCSTKPYFEIVHRSFLSSCVPHFSLCVVFTGLTQP